VSIEHAHLDLALADAASRAGERVRAVDCEMSARNRLLEVLARARCLLDRRPNGSRSDCSHARSRKARRAQS